MTEFNNQEYESYEKEFIEIVNDEFNSNSDELREETIMKLKSESFVNNLLLILNNFEDVDYKLSNVKFWFTKYMIYETIFSKDFYINVKEKVKDINISEDEYMKYLMLGGIHCTVVKNAYYKGAIEQSSKSDDIVQKVLCDFVKDEYNKNVTLLLEIYEDIKKYYPDDKETFSKVPQLLSENTFI